LEANVAALLAVLHPHLDFRRFFDKRGSPFRWLYRINCFRPYVSSRLFFQRPTFWNRLYWSFSFEHIRSNIKRAVAKSKFFNIGVTIVARAYDVPVKLKLSRGKSTWT